MNENVEPPKNLRLLMHFFSVHFGSSIVLIQGGSNMTGTDCGLFTDKSVPVIFEPPCIYGLKVICCSKKSLENTPKFCEMLLIDVCTYCHRPFLPLMNGFVAHLLSLSKPEGLISG